MASGLLCRGGSEAQLTVRTVLAGAWRVGLTQGVPEFVADPKGARVLWLYGHVGAGAAKNGLVGVALDSMASGVGAGAAKNGLVGVVLDSMASDVGAGAAKNSLVGVALDSMASGVIICTS